jgi:hypothetical protein
MEATQNISSNYLAPIDSNEMDISVTDINDHDSNIEVKHYQEIYAYETSISSIHYSEG